MPLIFQNFQGNAIKKDGVCYYYYGRTKTPVDTTSHSGAFSDCFACEWESSSSSSSSSGGYSSSSSSSSYDYSESSSSSSGDSPWYGAQKLYSLWLDNPNYTGDCLRIKRASDDGELDIGFDILGYLDEMAILSFCSGTTGNIVKWYDQSGNGLDLSHATGPAFFAAGKIIHRDSWGNANIFCDAPGNILENANTDMVSQPYTYLTHGKTIFTISGNTDASFVANADTTVAVTMGTLWSDGGRYRVSAGTNLLFSKYAKVGDETMIGVLNGADSVIAVGDSFAAETGDASTRSVSKGSEIGQYTSKNTGDCLVQTVIGWPSDKTNEVETLMDASLDRYPMSGLTENWGSLVDYKWTTIAAGEGVWWDLISNELVIDYPYATGLNKSYKWIQSTTGYNLRDFKMEFTVKNIVLRDKDSMAFMFGLPNDFYSTISLSGLGSSNGRIYTYDNTGSSSYVAWTIADVDIKVEKIGNTMKFYADTVELRSFTIADAASLGSFRMRFCGYYNHSPNPELTVTPLVITDL